MNPCESLDDAGTRSRLVLHKNYRGFNYEENYLEEWIARQPSAIFGSLPVLILASQNYLLCLATIQNAPGAVHTQEFPDIRT
jgi:hypothetical protein